MKYHYLIGSCYFEFVLVFCFSDKSIPKNDSETIIGTSPICCLLFHFSLQFLNYEF